MSHITEASAVITDLAALERAAGRLDGELRRGQKTHKWYGHWVGDTPLPEGTTRKDLGKCDHALRFKGCDYEAGVVDRGDGTYGLRYDYFDGKLLERLGGQNAERLTQLYGVERAKAVAQRKRMRTKEVVLSDGTIRLDMESV